MGTAKRSDGFRMDALLMRLQIEVLCKRGAAFLHVDILHTNTDKHLECKFR